MRKTRPGRLVARALMIAVPASVAVVTGGQALSAKAAAQPATVPTHLSSRHIGWNRPVVATGRLTGTDAGQQLELQYLTSGSSSWQTVATAVVRPDGSYRLSATLRRSGYMRVVDTSSTTPTPASATAAVAGSAPQRVAVEAAVRVRPQTLDLLSGQPATVHGRLFPTLAGRTVWLQGLSGGWRIIGHARTDASGRFTIHFTAPGGTETLRVRFGGDATNAKSGAPAGTVNVYQPSVASWYDDGGATACGFHAHYGVANRSLPCGTQVKFRYGGRTVTATVDDRGPYVGGRDWDLNQNTAAALGFGGVGTVWASF